MCFNHRLLSCMGSDRLVDFLVVALHNGLSTLLAVVFLWDRFHAINTSFEIVVHFASPRNWGISNSILYFGVFEFSLRDKLLNVTLLEVNIRRGELFLTWLVCNWVWVLLVVFGVLKSSLICPISCGAVGYFWLVSVDFDRSLIQIATPKNTRLEVLVLESFAIKTLSLEGRCSLDCSSICIIPVNSRSHQCAITGIFMKNFCRFSMEFFRHKVLPVDLLVAEHSTFRSHDQLVVWAGNVICLIFTEKSFSAFGLTTKLFSVNIVRGCTAKHCGFECVLGSDFGVLAIIAVKYIRLPGVVVTWTENSLRGLHRLLDGSICCSSGDIQRVWVLVGSASHSLSKCFFMKDVFMGARLNNLVAHWLLVKGMGREGVCAAISDLRGFDSAVMCDDICVVLTLL